jgi:hypothetical protein
LTSPFVPDATLQDAGWLTRELVARKHVLP